MVKMATKYAPAERLAQPDILIEHQKINDFEYLQDIFRSMPDVAMILNQHRQIIYSNDALVGFLPDRDGNLLLGQRPGEVISCIHSNENKGGCGTSESCRYCGAVNAILESQQSNNRVEKECRIVSFIEEEEISFDYRVTASPIMIRSTPYTMVFMKDISDEKRRIALERIFFHDIINIAGGIQGFTAFLNGVDEPETMKEYVKVVDKLSHDLIDELQSQRALTQAEHGDLKASPKELDIGEIMEDVRNSVSYHVVATDKDIIVNHHSGKIYIISDSILLKRVIINMAKNALESTPEKGEVILSAYSDNEGVVFLVHNNQYMNREVQLQVFKRSFSTKGKDRGLGTYSIKLLGERYLKGKVWFETDESSGTTFFIKVPYNLPV